MIFANSESYVLPEAFHPVSAQGIYGLEDVVWRIPRWLLRAWLSWMCEWDDLAISESSCCKKPSIKFLLKRIYGLEEDIG